MIPRELRPGIEEFVARLKALPGLEYVIIYGSAARGKYTDESDLDVLVVFADEESEKKSASKVRAAAAKVKGKLPVAPTIYNREILQEGDPDFFRGVFKEGVIVFSKDMREIPIKDALSAEPFALFSYSVEHLSAAEKSKFSHALFGRTTKSGGKEYRYGGLLERVGGKFLGKGAIIVRYSHAEELHEFFGKHRVKYEEYLVWVDKEYARKLYSIVGRGREKEVRNS